MTKKTSEKKVSWEQQSSFERNKDDLAKAERIRKALAGKYKADMYLRGSLAFGVNVPGKADYDYAMVAPTFGEYKRLDKRLSKDMGQSKYNKAGDGIKVFTTKLENEPIDVAVLTGREGLADKHLTKFLTKPGVISEAHKTKIVKEKIRLKNSWFLPKLRYYAYKPKAAQEINQPYARSRYKADYDFLCKGRKKCKEKAQAYFEKKSVDYKSHRKKALKTSKKMIQHLKNKFKTEVSLTGSLATGLNVPGESDFDFNMPARSIAHYEKLREKLIQGGFKSSSYNVPGADQGTYKGKLMGEEIDIILSVGKDKNKRRVQGIQNIQRTLGEEDKKEIRSRKAELKADKSMLGKLKYWNFKRGVDKKHDIPWTMKQTINPETLCKGNKRCQERVKKHIQQHAHEFSTVNKLKLSVQNLIHRIL